MVRRSLMRFVLALVLVPLGRSPRPLPWRIVRNGADDESGGALPGVEVTVTQTDTDDPVHDHQREGGVRFSNLPGDV